MNKVITIHLQGIAFQLEEAGHDTLRAYLDNAARQLAANPDRADIIADIEQAIADKLASRLKATRNVILIPEVEAVLTEIGPVVDGSSEPSADKTTFSSEQKPDSGLPNSGPEGIRPHKRLYRLKDGAMVAGVCNGLAAYLGIDVTLVRLIVAILIFVSVGTVLLAYLVAMIIIPIARSPEEKAAAGAWPTAQDFVRMAKDGYYTGMRTIRDPQARREWTRKFRRQMRD